MTDTHEKTRWTGLLEAWDQQQSGYLLQREPRFNVVLDALSPPSFRRQSAEVPLRILDLGCGPGSFTARLLTRFPHAQVVALDMDPVLLAIGQGALGKAGGRLSWVDADLRTPGWHTQLGSQPFDAVVSSTALHWLGPAQLTALYGQLAQLITPGGRFLNADNMAYDHKLPTLASPDWDSWWKRAINLPELAAARTEKDKRSEQRPADSEDHVPLTGLTTLRLHVAALGQAGFAEVGTIWQHHDDRVLLAIRSASSQPEQPD